MKVRFDKAVSVSGHLDAPPSKSFTHRALLVARCVAGGTVRRLLDSEDTNATMRVVQNTGGSSGNTPTTAHFDRPAPFRWQRPTLEVGESGTLLRFLLPLVTVLPGPEEVTLVGEDTLAQRSNRDLVESLRANGYRVEGTGEEETVPVTCYPGQGLPEDGPVETVADTTSQLLSGWLITLAAAGGGRVKRTTDLVSGPYVEMTREVLHETGVNTNVDGSTYRVDGEPSSLDYTVPGDYSSAAFWLVAGSLTPGPLTVGNLNPDDPQADRRIVELLDAVGVDLERQGKSVVVHGPTRPEPFTIDAGDCPDLVPVLAVLALWARGKSTIEGIPHLANKESDRINRTAEELSLTGARVTPEADRLTVDPTAANWFPGSPSFDDTVQFSAHADHRLAMAFSVLGMAAGSVEIQGGDSVAKSYPDFYRDCDRLGIPYEEFG